MVALRNDHIFAFCAVQKSAHVLKLFQRNAYALPSFSHFSHFNRGSKEQRARTWRKTERKRSLNTVKSASRTMSTTAAAPSKANKAHGCLDKRPYLHIFTLCAVQKCARILKLFQRNAYALPSFSHFSHFIYCTCMTDQLKSTCHAY